MSKDQHVTQAMPTDFSERLAKLRKPSAQEAVDQVSGKILFHLTFSTPHYILLGSDTNTAGETVVSCRLAAACEN